ncbi:MAG: methyltransferase domain-containing protein [Spirochaetaceae bacterium]|nr:methyltransferase domain-containing protein [Spirochaetaceae bacterium]
MEKMAEEWFEKENFWLEYGPIMFDAQHWAEAPGVAEAVCKIAELSAGSSILDACCGPGRVSVEFALLGLKVTGVDIMQSFLDAAKETADDEGVPLELIRADMRTYESAKKFDAACNLYTSFGYCSSIEEDLKIIKSIAKCVKPGGCFVMELLSREVAVRNFIEGEWFERAGKTVLTEFTVEGAWEGLRSRWILIDNKTGKRIEHCFVQRLYSAPELRNLVLGCGFESVEIFGGFDLSKYDQNAKTMVLVARTPK